MSGWTSEFFTTCMDSYICAICREVCKDATTTNCGHTFCNSCIIKSAFTYPSNCPVCRTLIVQSVPDFSKRVLIMGSHMHCMNKEHGCSEVNALSRIIEHVKQCPYKLEKCTLCNKQVVLCSMQQHIENECENRLVECNKCSKMVKYHSFTTHKLKKCPMLDVSCPYCDWTGILSNMEQHTMSCIKTPRPCTYKNYGCTEMITFECKEEHDKNTDHLSIVCKEIDVRTQITNQYIDSIRPDGPYLLKNHPHEVIFCSAVSNTCSNCHKLISTNNELSLAYECKESTCNYKICISCFPKLRLYKSKHLISFLTGFNVFNIGQIDE